MYSAVDLERKIDRLDTTFPDILVISIKYS